MDGLNNNILSEQSNKKGKKPISSGNKNFRKHNKLGFYRFMQKKKKKKPAKAKS